MTDLLASIPSPSQGVWNLGPLPIRAYALCILAGIFVAIWIGGRRWVDRGGAAGTVADVAVWAVPFGIVGGRLYHVITDWQLYFGATGSGWVNALRIWDGGLGIWGAVLLGGVGAWIGVRRKGIPLPPFADAIAPGIAVAQAIGRLGNYFNQELFGSPTTLPWGLEVFVRTPDGVAGAIPASGTCEFPTEYIKAAPEVLCGVYQPTFLYEILWNLGVAALVVWADRRFNLGGGRAFAVYVAGYTLGRTWIEMLRIDPANHFFGLRINVFTSVIVFLGAVLFLFLRRNVGREDPALVRGPARHGDTEESGAPDDVDPSSGDVPVPAGDGEHEGTTPNATSSGERPGAPE